MDITHLILDEHQEQRRLFSLLEQIDSNDVPALGAVWSRLRALLEVHADAEERFFYPTLLAFGQGAGGADSAGDETEDAIEDHNDIRDAIAEADRETVGSDAWRDAVDRANEANSEHMGEEERQGLTDFRRHAPLQLRHDLGVRFLAHGTKNVTGVEPVALDPKAYVEEHERSNRERVAASEPDAQ